MSYVCSQILKKIIMKKIIVLLFVCLCFSAGSVYSLPPTSEEEIEIRDIVAGSTVLRSSPAPAVSAWLSETQINLTFLLNLGAVTITVANEQSSVYSATLTAGEGTAAVINTAGWSPGDYTITIVRSNGKTYAGGFEL
jgi:hypothetical protein